MYKKGFTLIELMIVIAIIAFLAMVSIPSFKMFLAKAKRAEAYMNLNAIATEEKVYWAEHGTYSNSLNDIGWKQEGAIQYTYGFGGTEGKNYITGSLKAPSSELQGAKADKTSFVAVAAGDIDGDGESDIISINEKNEIKIIKDDLKN